jgi:dihydroflavonol-4-reductase
MTALVTGATGLLGGNLVRALVSAGRQVRVVVRDVDQARQALAGLDLEYVRGDLADVAAWAPRLRGVDVVYGCAAYFSEYYGPGRHDGALQRLNVDAAVDLARAADRYGVGTFVHTSTIGITGPTASADGLSDESCAPDRRSLANGYHASKWRAERALGAELATLDVRVPFVRPGWLLGPGDGSSHRAPTASGQLLLDVVNGKLPAVPPGGNHCTDARDVAAVLVSAAEHGRSGVAYHAAAPWLSMGDVIATIAAQAAVPAPKRRLPAAAWYLLTSASEAQAAVTRRRPLVTRDGIAALQEKRRVSSQRAVDELGATFRPFADTVRDELTYYRRTGILTGAAIPQPTSV